MNGVLTKGGMKHFMTFIDDSTRYCYVYLMRTKYEALDYFKICKAEVENQLERKIKRVQSVMVESSFLVSSIYSIQTMV